MVKRILASLGVVGLLLCLLPGPTEGYHILVLTPFGTRSVRTTFAIVCEGLLAKGHNVTLISSGEPIPIHKNFTHAKSPHTEMDEIDLFKIRLGLSVFKIWKKAFPVAAKQMYKSEEILNIWNHRQDFDGIIINSAANEMAFPFLLNTTSPFITLQPSGIDPQQLAQLGNIITPAAMPSIILPYDNFMTFWERLVNTITMVVLKYSFHKAINIPLMAALQPIFPDLPDPRTVYPGQNLALFNSHPLVDGAVPMLPTQVEVGCLSCKPVSEIRDTKLRQFLDGAAVDGAAPDGATPDGAALDGAVFFSLGSLQSPSKVPKAYVRILLDAFGQLPQYRFVALLDATGQMVPDNVMVDSWFKQQDLLGHPNVRLFMSHCGRSSTNEALYHGVPVLGIPIAFDQPRQCKKLEYRGYATVLQWETLNVTLVKQTILNMMTDKRYMARVTNVSQRLTAEKETGLDKAVRSIEDVISTFQDEDLMRCSASQLSLAQYFLIDVFAVLSVIALLLALIIVYVVRLLYRCLGKQGKGEHIKDD